MEVVEKNIIDENVERLKNDDKTNNNDAQIIKKNKLTGKLWTLKFMNLINT